MCGIFWQSWSACQDLTVRRVRRNLSIREDTCVRGVKFTAPIPWKKRRVCAQEGFQGRCCLGSWLVPVRVACACRPCCCSCQHQGQTASCAHKYARMHFVHTWLESSEQTPESKDNMHLVPEKSRPLARQQTVRRCLNFGTGPPACGFGIHPGGALVVFAFLV